MAKVVLFSRVNRQTLGGVELFNSNLRDLLQEQAVCAEETSATQTLLKSYFTRLLGTARLLKTNPGASVLVQYGSFLDVLFLPFLRLLSSNIFIIAHVSSTWKHLRNPLFKVLTITLMKLTCRQVLVLSEDQAVVFRRLPTTKIHTIIHPAFAHAAPGAGALRNGFVFVGRITRSKGVFDLVSAWSLLGRHAPRLRIYGSGDNETVKTLSQEIHNAGLDEVISLEGSIRDPLVLQQIYGAAKATVYPSYSDAFPLVMLESVSQGTPCVVCAVGEVANFMGNSPHVLAPGDVKGLARVVAQIRDDTLPFDDGGVLMSNARRYASGGIVHDLIDVGVI